MPEFDVTIYEHPGAKGVSGMAESPIIPTSSAIANAVFNACGARVRELPITPRHLLAALKAAGKGVAS
jgi:CO/xanthine dehydrogenase Mo-binding subunit